MGEIFEKRIHSELDRWAAFHTKASQEISKQLYTVYLSNLECILNVSFFSYFRSAVLKGLEYQLE